MDTSADDARASTASYCSSSSSADRESLHSSAQETWTFRSTIGASSDGDDIGDDDDGGNDEEDSSVDAASRHFWCTDGQQDGDTAALQDNSKKPKLLSLAGFSNDEALKARLPVRRAAPVPVSLPIAQRHKKSGKQHLRLHSREGKLDALFPLDNDKLVAKKRQQRRPVPFLEIDDDEAREKSLEHKIAMHGELTAMESKKLHEAQKSSMLLPQFEAPDSRRTVLYRMSTLMVYALAFTSTAALHCGLFNFSLEIRRLFRLDTVPFGVFLLVCWAIVGLLSFTGGWIGDLVHDRVVLLRRAAVLWVASVVLLHLAAFRAVSTLSAVLLSLALPGACLAHGIIAPNCVVLGAEKYARSNDRRRLNPSQSESPLQLLHSGDDADVSNKCEQERLSSEDEEAVRRLCAAKKMAIHKYFSRCFGATLAGSSCVQLFFFLLVDVEVPPGSSKRSLVGRKGFLCMLFSSLLLLATLIVFLFQSRTHFQPRARSLLERKLELHEKLQGAFTWRAVLRVFSRAVVGCVCLVALLVTFVGMCIAFFGMLLDASFNTRLAAFLMIFLGWHAAMSIGKVQLSASGRLSRKCRSLGVPLVQLESALLLLFFVCMSSLSAFLRAQLYTTLVVQICQTRLDIPGADARFDPNTLGAFVSLVSLLLIPISNTTRFGRKQAPHGASTREYRVTSISPSRRLSIGICLSLVGIFLSSVVELYRRTKVIVAQPQMTCNKAYSEFGFMWTVPHLVFLGLSDMVFRVSLQEQLYSLNLLSTRWPGFVRGMIHFSDMVGYVGALSLTSMLSTWLFRPTTSDLALALLLLTTLLAFSYSSLKRVAEKIAEGHVMEGVPG